VFGPALRLVPCPSFDALFHAVATGDAARGIVPIENSLAGSVHENYDLLRGGPSVEPRPCVFTRDE
jgi:prephenate dehydratase